MSLAKISSMLGISKNTIKSYCQRLQAANENAPDSHGCCENCGIPIRYIKGRVPPRFCSDKCRSAWWNAHPDQLSSHAMMEVCCDGCGTIFRSFPSRHRRYCSRKCYITTRYGEMKQHA